MLMINAFNSGLSGLGLSTSQEHCVVFLVKTVYSHSASFLPGVQRGPAYFMLGGGSRHIPSHFTLQKTEICYRLMGHLVYMQT